MSAGRLTYDEWRPEEEMLREALCTLGNGNFCTRGAAEEHRRREHHYPGTYLAGGYNRAKSEVDGRVIENEDLVNWPNWLFLTFKPVGGRWLDLSEMQVDEFSQVLDSDRGTLTRRFQVTDSDGRTTAVVSRRFVHLSRPHICGLSWDLEPINWSGRLAVRGGVDGSVENLGVKRYQGLASKHLMVTDRGKVEPDTLYLVAESRQSRTRMAQALRHRFYDGEGQPFEPKRELDLLAEEIYERFTFEARQNQSVRVEKLVVIHTSHDFGISEPLSNALDEIPQIERFDELLKEHQKTWQRLWHRCNFSLIDHLPWAENILHIHIFHVLQTVSNNSIERDCGVPARGWHGEAYRGHIFWDELFIFPFLNLHLPELTRELLMYRYRRLSMARKAAKRAGLAGALYPWQSGSDGREESQRLHLNPMSGRWVEDNTYRQRHVNAAIAYNIWQYYEATGDMEFLSFYGVEMLVEIARFWASIVTYNTDRKRYDIKGVVGPDEFHTGYPGQPGGPQGVDNNTYTNVMASWVLKRARLALDMLEEDRRQDLAHDLNLTDDELTRWDEISQHLFVPFINNDILAQFEGYEKLKELDWEAYRQKYGDIHRLDRILSAENQDPNAFKVAKQADVLMLFYVLSAEELDSQFKHLGYDFDPACIPANVDYYLSRTSHGSTLSRLTHAWVLARTDRSRSWELFTKALYSDIEDVQGGTTAEGIHLGAMASSIDVIQRCYPGIEMRDDTLWLNPQLPAELKDFNFRIRYRSHWLCVSLNSKQLRIKCEKGWSKPAKIGFRDKVFELEQGGSLDFPLSAGE